MESIEDRGARLRSDLQLFLSTAFYELTGVEDTLYASALWDEGLDDEEIAEAARELHDAISGAAEALRDLDATLEDLSYGVDASLTAH